MNFHTITHLFYNCLQTNRVKNLIRLCMYLIRSLNFWCVVSLIIMWQGGLELNPSVLNGSFSIGISPYGPFPW